MDHDLQRKYWGGTRVTIQASALAVAWPAQEDLCVMMPIHVFELFQTDIPYVMFQVKH